MDIVNDTVLHLWEGYEKCLEAADPRVADWLLMHAYYPTLCLTALYVASVWIGPMLMKNREPFHFRFTLFIYNAVLVAINYHICSELFLTSWKLNYSYSCQPVSYTDDPDEMRVARALWWYYFSKLVEFLDTIFFVLRKKNNQISFLHVYHHATMFPIWWIGVKWVAGGQSFFGAMMNSFIHVIMYSYYGISALGPEYQKYLWWKKYLTRIQLVQFVVGMVHASQSLYFTCDFPDWMHWALIFYGFSMLVLFLNFYVHSYMSSKHRTKKSKESVSGTVSNGHVTQNGDVIANGMADTKKDK